MRPISVRFMLLALAVLLMTACALPSARPAAGIIVTESKDAVITAESRGNVLILDVRGETGIGTAQISLAAGAAPRDMILRLHLRGLENLAFTWAAGALQVSVPSYGEPIVRETFTPAGESKARPIERGSPFWMDVGILSNDPAATPAIPLENGHFDVSAPQDFLEGGSTDFKLSWIDFYR